MKEGLFREDGQWIYYKHDKPYHAGVIKIDDKTYYIGKGGVAAVGEHIVHGEMTNGLLERGTYRFDENGVLIEGSFIPRRKKSKLKSLARKIKPKSKRSTKKLTKKNRQRLVLALSIVVIFVLTVVCLQWLDAHHTPPVSSGDPADSAAHGDYVLPAFDNEVLLCSQMAKDYYDGRIDITSAVNSGDPYRAFVFKYDLKGQSGRLRLSESADLQNAKEYVLPIGGSELAIDNLKVNTTYYYTVDVGEESFDGQFQTAQSSRFVYMPGVINTRDIGGYTTQSGRTVKQGMIVRGTELDGLEHSAYLLDSDAIESVQETFGFVFEMDLRSDSVFSGPYRSRLGDNVGHRFFNASAYGAVFNESYRASLRDQFRTLADEHCYPMYMHCTYGADRTGTLVFLLQGVLGMSDEDLMREYRLTAYTSSEHITLDYIDALVGGLQGYQGDTLAEKIEDFLVSDVGVTPDELQTIRSILLEP